MSFQAIREIIDANEHLEIEARDAIIKRIWALSDEFDAAINSARDTVKKGLGDIAQIIAEKSSGLIGEAQGEAMKQAAE